MQRDVAIEWSLQDVTLQLAIQYFDFSCCAAKVGTRDLQLLALASIVVAAKFNCRNEVDIKNGEGD
jgi:hypothetical protein